MKAPIRMLALVSAIAAVTAAAAVPTTSTSAVPSPVDVERAAQAPTVKAIPDTLPLALNDTIVPMFSITKDSVLSVVKVNSVTGLRGAITVKKCGSSTVFIRLMQHGVSIGEKRVTVPVCQETTVPGTPPAEVATVDVCLDPNPDSMLKYHVRGDTAIDDKLVPCRSKTVTLEAPAAGTSSAAARYLRPSILSTMRRAH